MTAFAQQESPYPDSPDLPEALPNLTRAAGWMLLANLFSGSVFFLEFQWYSQNIYPFSSWIPFLSNERIDTVIDVL